MAGEYSETGHFHTLIMESHV